MPLTDLIYRCPFCGTATVKGKGVEAHCPGCERVYQPATTGDGLRVRGPDGSDLEIEVGALLDRTGSLGGDGTVLESSALASFAYSERPVRYRDALIGFFEERRPSRPGQLRLDDRTVQFTEGSGELHEWSLLDLRAVQTASAAVQISPLVGGLVSFRILDDSPRRWEEALKSRLRSVWRDEGRGEIFEFQPRIRTR